MIGPNTYQAIDTILSRVEYEVQAFRSCVGVLNLARRYSDASLEEACTEAVAHNRVSYRYIKDSLALAGSRLARDPSTGEGNQHEQDHERYVLNAFNGPTLPQDQSKAVHPTNQTLPAISD